MQHFFFYQLAVWEWRSETYLLKQQGHKTGIRCVATAPVIDSASTARGLDGRSNALGLGQRNLIVATGGEDGKIKLWDTDSGFNFMTFAEHTAAVNDVVFTPQVRVIAVSLEVYILFSAGKCCALCEFRWQCSSFRLNTLS